MSLHLEFEPHSWYMDFAIKNNRGTLDAHDFGTEWTAYTDNGNTYRVDELAAPTLRELKEQIKKYRGICKRQGCRKTNVDYAGVCPSHR